MADKRLVFKSTVLRFIIGIIKGIIKANVFPDPKKIIL